jgi:HYR domain
MRSASVLPAPSRDTDGSCRSTKTPSVLTAGIRLLALSALALTLTAIVAKPAAAQLVASPNVNVAGGPACLKSQDPSCPAQVFGDVPMQRQNELSMACSSRNPQTCLAAGNDYRLIDLPGVNDGKVTADAWMGIFWTRNAGQSWRSSLLPGWKTSDPLFKDTTPEGAPAQNPIAGFEAAADATVRAGTHGLFYVSGIAFNRADEANGTSSALSSGGEGKSGVQFVATYIDDNNTSDPNTSPRYLRLSIVDNGTSGRFLDKPWIIGDKPRGSATCTIPAGPGGVPAAQTIQAGVVYVAWATFLGSGNNPHSDIWVKNSRDCGATWSNATKLTSSIPLSQSPIIVLNPNNGNVHVVWREFGQGGSPDRILTASSTNEARTFGKPVEAANLGVPSPVTYWPGLVSSAFDQTTLPNGGDPLHRMARTNGYPSACVGTDGKLRVVFSKRISQPDWPIQFARVMMATQTGSGWTAVPVDNHAGPGHQFQPSMACTGIRVTVSWYDQRNDTAFLLNPLGLSPEIWNLVFFPFIIDPVIPPPAHTVDVRAAQTDQNGVFQPGTSIQVSKYPLVFDTQSGTVIKLQDNFINAALFGGGYVPFVGDYNDTVPRNIFTPPLCMDATCAQLTDWTFNDFANESPIVHLLWTDNRDLLQTAANAGAIDYTNYLAPGSLTCDPKTTLTWTRNQNPYTAFLASGFVMQAEGNARRTKDLEKRAYVVQMQNLTAPVQGQETSYKKRFRLTFAANSGQASFDFATDFTVPSSVLKTIYIDLPYASGGARTVFVRKNSTAPIIVIGEEVRAFDGDGDEIPLASCGQSSGPCTLVAGGGRSRVIIAPDPQAPVQNLVEESHDVSLEILPVLQQAGGTGPSLTYTPPTGIPDLTGDPSFSTNLMNPTWVSPTWVSPTWVSPTWVSPTWVSPTWVSPTWVSPTWVSPTWVSPTWVSPTWVSRPVITETSYIAQGTGTVTSGYDLDAILQSLPQGAIMQVVVSKVYSAPGTNSCAPTTQVQLQPVANVTTLNGAVNTSFSLAPGEQAVITVKVACDSPESGSCYDPQQNSGIVLTKQAPDCVTSPDLLNPDPPKCEQPENLPTVIDTAPPMISFNPTSPATVQGTGPNGAQVSYSAAAADAVDAVLGLTVQVSCTIGGESVPSAGTRLFPYGETTVECAATDSHDNTATTAFRIIVVDTLAPVVTVPSNVTLEAASSAGTPYTYSASALDNVDGAITPVCAPASGSTFPVNSTLVTCTATDAAGNEGSASFTVTVVDTIAPVLTVPANIAVVMSVSATTASVTYSASATDLGQPVSVTCTSVAGPVTTFPVTQPFPVGTTTVTCTANDGRGNTATKAFTVTAQQGYGILGPLSPYQSPPKTYNSGSSIPIVWKFTIGGVAVDSPYAVSQPELQFVKVNTNNCAAGGPEYPKVLNSTWFVSSDFPGNSNFQYFGLSNPHPAHGAYTWQLNWTSPSQPATCWNVYIGSRVTGQSTLRGRVQLKN